MGESLLPLAGGVPFRVVGVARCVDVPCRVPLVRYEDRFMSDKGLLRVLLVAWTCVGIAGLADLMQGPQPDLRSDGRTLFPLPDGRQLNLAAGPGKVLKWRHATTVMPERKTP